MGRGWGSRKARLTSWAAALWGLQWEGEHMEEIRFCFGLRKPKMLIPHLGGMLDGLLYAEVWHLVARSGCRCPRRASKGSHESE